MNFAIVFVLLSGIFSVLQFWLVPSLEKRASVEKQPRSVKRPSPQKQATPKKRSAPKKWPWLKWKWFVKWRNKWFSPSRWRWLTKWFAPSRWRWLTRWFLPSTWLQLIEDGRRAIGRNAPVYLACFARNALLVMALTTGGLILALLILNRMGGSTIDEVCASVARVRFAHVPLSGFGLIFGSIICALLTVSMLVASYRMRQIKIANPDANREQRIRTEVEAFFAKGGQQFNRSDLEAAIEHRLSQITSEPTGSKSFVERLQILLLTDLLANTLNAKHRKILLAGMALLVPSLLGLYSRLTSQHIRATEVKLEDLRLTLNREEWSRQKEALGPKRPDALAASTIRDIDLIARAYEVSDRWPQLENSSVLTHPGSQSSAPDAFNYRAVAVRDYLVHTASTEYNGEPASPVGRIAPNSGTSANGTANKDKHVDRQSGRWQSHETLAYARHPFFDDRSSEVFSAPLDSPHPVTASGRLFGLELVEVAQRQPTLVQKIHRVAELVRSAPFQQEMSLRALKGTLFSQVVSVALDRSDQSSLPDLARSAIDEDDLPTVRWVEEHPRNILLGYFLSQDSNDTEILTTLAKNRPKRCPLTNEDIRPVARMTEKVESATLFRDGLSFVDKIATARPSTLDYVAQSDSMIKQTRSLLDSLTLSGNPVAADEKYMSLANFQDFVPARGGDDLRTPFFHSIEQHLPPSDPRRTYFPVLVDYLLSNGRPETPDDPVLMELDAYGPRPPALPFTTVHAAERSVSYSNMAGSAETGGVLIGKLPNDSQGNSKASSFTLSDIQWKAEQGGIHLILTTGDGKTLRSPLYPTSMLRAALYYAADPRPLALMFVNQWQLPEQQVLLHPALVDTAIGNRVIELNHMLFDVLAPGGQRHSELNKAIQIVNDSKMLYEVANYSRQLAMLTSHLQTILAKEKSSREKIVQENRKARTEPHKTQKPRQTQPQEPTIDTGSPTDPVSIGEEGISSDGSKLNPDGQTSDMSTLEQEYKSLVADEQQVRRELANRQKIYDGLKKLDQKRRSRLEANLQSGLFLDSSQSPITAKREYFDKDLVAMMQSTSKQTTNLNQFMDSIRDQAAAQWNQYSDMEQDRYWNRWAAEAPQFTLPGSVHESDYTLQTEDVCLLEGKSPSKTLGLVIQIAFTTTPAFLEDLSPGMSPEHYFDQHPWNFPTVQPGIDQRFDQLLHTDPRRQQVLDDVTRFTYLQRLFRLALHGALGHAFPVEKLASLSIALKADAPPTNGTSRTPRWYAISETQLSSNGQNALLPGINNLRQILATESEAHLSIERHKQSGLTPW